MATYEYLVTAFIQGSLCVLRGTVTAPDEDSVDEAVYRNVEEKSGYSIERDGLVSLFVTEMEGVDQ